jgi:hypothetical protein
MTSLKQIVLPASVLLAMVAVAANAQQTTGGPAAATGEACRKEICDSAVAGCMRADLSLNPLAGTEAEKKVYCAQFFSGCMNRYITPDLPWYSPEMAIRFTKCPS